MVVVALGGWGGHFRACFAIYFVTSALGRLLGGWFDKRTATSAVRCAQTHPFKRLIRHAIAALLANVA